METDQHPPELPKTPEEKRTSTVFERLTNVIADPAEAFSGLADRPARMPHWAVPLVIQILVAVIYSVTIFSQADLVDTVRQQQVEAIDDRVASGEISELEAGEIKDQISRYTRRKILILTSLFASVFFTPLVFAALGAVFHWIARIGSRHHIPFPKCIEVIGLCSVVSSVGMLVNLLLVMITGNLSMTLSLALAFQDFDPSIKTHAMAAEVDIVRLWYIWVLGVAWSRLTGHPFTSCVTWLLGAWVTYRTLSIVLFL